MARELGMNPKKLGGKANHQQEPWKVPVERVAAFYDVAREYGCYEPAECSRGI